MCVFAEQKAQFKLFQENMNWLEGADRKQALEHFKKNAFVNLAEVQDSVY